MPYTKAFREAHPELVKSRQAAANARYAQVHPERVKKQKAVWYDKHKEAQIARHQNWLKNNQEAQFYSYLLRKYKLTKDEYDAMVSKQDGKCAICHEVPITKRRNGVSVRFDVDHNHLTGMVRGLLCHPCNIMLGQARDRIEILSEAILYLKTNDQSVRNFSE